MSVAGREGSLVVGTGDSWAQWALCSGTGWVEGGGGWDIVEEPGGCTGMGQEVGGMEWRREDVGSWG